MPAGTGRAGLTRPGRTWSVLALWQRLNLRPLPHQQGSLALRARAVIEVVAMTRPGYRASDPTLLVRSTAGRGCEDAARLAHPSRRQRHHPAAEPIPGQGVQVVEVDDTVRWHTIGAGREIELGHEAAAGTGQSSHHPPAHPASHPATRQPENRPGAAR